MDLEDGAAHGSGGLATSHERRTWWATALPLAAVGLVMGPVMMEPTYSALSVRLGPASLLIVELVFAFLIDIPLAGAFVLLRSLTHRPPPEPARSALAFVGVFFGLIATCIVLTPVHPLFAWLGLDTTFRPAVAEALGTFGAGALAAMLVFYLAFDLLLCAAAGMAGAELVRSERPRRP